MRYNLSNYVKSMKPSAAQQLVLYLGVYAGARIVFMATVFTSGMMSTKGPALWRRLPSRFHVQARLEKVWRKKTSAKLDNAARSRQVKMN